MAMRTMMQKSYSCNESDNGDTNENIDYIVNIDCYYCYYCYYLETMLEAEEVVVAND